jgi:hypothetical protein
MHMCTLSHTGCYEFNISFFIYQRYKTSISRSCVRALISGIISISKSDSNFEGNPPSISKCKALISARVDRGGHDIQVTSISKLHSFDIRSHNVESASMKFDLCGARHGAPAGPLQRLPRKGPCPWHLWGGCRCGNHNLRSRCCMQRGSC